MIVNILESPLSVITPESELEKKLLESDLFNSRLAFQIYQNCVETGLVIRLDDGKSIPIEYNGSIAHISVDNNDIKRITYLLRATLDAYSVNNSCLPLHAAYIQSDTRGIVLTAGTGRGKSLMFNKYTQSSNILVGDDHIIIRDEIIVGNKVTRIRNRMGESFYNPINSAPLSMKPYIIVLVDISDIDDFSEVSKKEMIMDNRLNRPLLKYLTQGIMSNGLCYSTKEIFGEDVVKEYILCYIKFIERAEKIVNVSGSPEFMKREIDVMLR